MKFSLITLSAVSSLCSAELVQFKSNSPAKADEVNRNFFVLDSAKADKGSVGVLTTAVNAKADARLVEDLAKAVDGKATSSSVKDLGDRHDSLLKGVKAGQSATPWTAPVSALGSRHDSLLKATRDGLAATPWVAPISALGSRHDSLLKGVKDGQAASGWNTPLANLTSRHDSLLSGVRAKPDTAVAWKAIRDTSANLRTAISQSKVTSLPWASVTSKPRIWEWDSTVIGSWYGSLGGKIVAGMAATGLNADYGGLALRLRAAGASSMIDLIVDGYLNSWGANGGIQTNSVTRIDGGGNAAFPQMAVGSEKIVPSALKTPLSIYPSGAYYNEGIEIFPSSGNGYNGLFLRGNETDETGTIGLVRSKDGQFFITFRDVGGMAGTFDPTTPFSIDPKGNTHIGGELDVRGRFLAHSASVTDLQVAGNLVTRPTTPWADYVFEPGYQTMPLKEIEAYAKEHKHLPEVPSTADVEKDGIDIARMNAILLKKVEELTLHAVEQEKKMDALQAKVEALEARRDR
ncbi:MAG: hypothetical protein IPK50_04030 [Fibrobacterota bacterium]|nr:MAG: hypothetical protein IPK50_04030 [Fibrobacterota bacterium]